MKRTISRLPSTLALELGVFAAMLALSMLQAGAQNTNITASTSIPTPTANIITGGNVNIGSIPLVTVTINDGGLLQSGGLHIGQSANATAVSS